MNDVVLRIDDNQDMNHNHALLYIEDQESNIALVKAILKRRPHVELHVAMNGGDGVRAAIDIRPGLILLDNHLPDATGSQILQQLASASATAAIPVVILSGDTGEVVDELLASGAAESVEKPFNIHQFIGIIDRYLAA
jgi:CheY-like chemotaxis protein